MSADDCEYCSFGDCDIDDERCQYDDFDYEECKKRRDKKKRRDDDDDDFIGIGLGLATGLFGGGSGGFGGFGGGSFGGGGAGGKF